MQKRRDADARLEHLHDGIPQYRIAEGLLLFYRKQYGSPAPHDVERAARDHRDMMTAVFPAFALAVREEAFE